MRPNASTCRGEASVPPCDDVSAHDHGGFDTVEPELADASPLRPRFRHGLRRRQPTTTMKGPSDRPRGTMAGSVGAILQNLKSVTARRINRLRGTPGARVWQRNYWERVIRSEAELERIRMYIQENPLRWKHDAHHT